jgi:hypothetical protein
MSAVSLRSIECRQISAILSRLKTTYILEKDQLWKLPEAHIKIVGVGRHLTHFKHCKTLDQKRVSTQVETIDDLQKYLQKHRGKLIKEHGRLKKAA